MVLSILSIISFGRRQVTQEDLINEVIYFLSHSLFELFKFIKVSQCISNAAVRYIKILEIKKSTVLPMLSCT